ncbi:MAG: hypothetical protein EKK46_12675 [Rhodocyclaceae bacterium]|nr:MAG: hypothetical protein EKK46_12675 [Rhodocyclaceae bacterium]
MLGKEPMVVQHDRHGSPLFSDTGLHELLASVPDDSIKVKTAHQDYGELFSTRQASRQTLLQLIDTPSADCWIALHEVESTSLLKPLFTAMAAALMASLPPRYGAVLYCTGSLFISRGKASTPYHLDYGSNLLLQLRGHKHFMAFSPNDPTLVSRETLRQFFSGDANPHSLHYDPAHDHKALALDLAPGMGIYMPSTTPHCTETRTQDLSITASLSFVSPLAERLRRSSLFDNRVPPLRFLPQGFKHGVVAAYEGLRALNGDLKPRHKSFRPLPL